ncbi:MAG: putative aminophospholipid-translocase [Geoglossum umbratile]|nr:MAG: putative aminophospholipid-translocase [Geoglossum umbratile]
MPSSPSYHQPNAPDSPEDSDSESDLEIELQELGPATTPSPQRPRRSREGQRTERERRGQIPLRNLRMGGLRGLGGRRKGYGELGPAHGGEGEDLHELLYDAEDPGASTRDSGASLGNFEDDAPLLHPLTTGRHRGQESVISRLGSKMRLPSFLSTASRPATPTEGPELEQEQDDPTATRTVLVGQVQALRFPANAVSNAKYTPWSFLPITLYTEFSFFFNLYYLMVALSQIIPALRVGYLSTYIAPLAFVVSVVLGKEALDDIARRRRDAEANSEGYAVLRFKSAPEHGVRTGRSGSQSMHAPRGMRRGWDRRSEERLSEIPEEDETVDSGIAGRPTASYFETITKSRDIKVGDILKLGKDQRVPADVIILKSYTNDSAVLNPYQEGDDLSAQEPEGVSDDPTNPASGPPAKMSTATEVEGSGNVTPTENMLSADGGGIGESFIRTDQLDGETDWKLRLASPLTQSLETSEFTRLRIVAGKPDKKVNEFIGTIELLSKPLHSHGPRAGRGEGRPSRNGGSLVPRDEGEMVTLKSTPLTVDNTAWANTVIASNCTTLAVVVYTGSQTRQALSTSPSRSKVGLLEYEINSLTKILFILTLAISVTLVALKGIESTSSRKWYVSIMRFLVLFSTIIPISLRVNLDMGKTVYAWFIERDDGIKGTVVRTSTIPEELGRVEYLLSDKTGTLTQNEMDLRKIHVGTVSYANEAMDEVSSYVRQGFSIPSSGANQPSASTPSASAYSALTAANNPSAHVRTRREIGSRVRDVVLALALCHNVTPTLEDDNGNSVITYQASSPDEIAIVKWTESVGLRLVHRDRKGMTLQSVSTGLVVARVRILDVFPFTSEGKRMGVIIQFVESSESSATPIEEAGEIWFYQKGADTVMASIVAANDWLDEETANMAREGLRTLVVGRKKLSLQRYREFASNYKQASLSLVGREAGMAKAVGQYLECDLELLGVTGVEDKLQKDVKPSLELLRNAGIKIWMLTGDKVETARCVAVSAKLVARGQYVHTIAKLKRKDLAEDSLNFLRSKTDACLLIDGESLSLFLTHYRDSFISLAVLLPAVIACRCSPNQKAEIAKLIRAYTKKRICCIGDGGNDVSMIQAADVGVGIVGKEGRQASLAADFSIDQFCHLTKLLVWHGRNSYKRSAKLAQFVIHRGLIISVCQTMFSIASSFEPIALYKNWLLVGYATVYTMFPVFSLVLDKDVDEGLANLYPELYKELTEGRSLSYRTFFVWVFISIYQGGMIQGLSQILVDVQGPKMVSVSFTVLVINELIMVALEITTWHPVMIFTLIGTALLYLGTIPFLGEYFDLAFIISVGFWWRVLAILAISLVPPYAVKLIRRTLKPPSYRKVRGI